jgi:hypothetical protein
MIHLIFMHVRYVNIGENNIERIFYLVFYVIGYTQLKSIDTIRTPKLSGRRRGWYYGGGPLTISRADNEPGAVVSSFSEPNTSKNHKIRISKIKLQPIGEY